MKDFNPLNFFSTSLLFLGFLILPSLSWGQEDNTEKSDSIYSEERDIEELSERYQTFKGVKEVDLEKAFKNLETIGQTLSQEELEENIRLNNEKFAAGKILNKYPRLISFQASLIKDPEAMQGLLRFIEAKDKLIKYSLFFLCSILMGWALAGWITKETTFFQGLMRRFILFVAMNTLRIGVFSYMFQEELGAFYRLAKTKFL